MFGLIRFFEDEDVVTAESDSITLNIENQHLIIWVEDSFGVISRKDCWFYDAAASTDVDLSNQEINN